MCVSSPPNWPAISRLYILFLEFSLFSSVRDIIQCTEYSAQRTSNTEKCTVYMLQFTVWGLQSTLYSVKCTLYSVQYTATETVLCKVETTAWTVLPKDIGREFITFYPWADDNTKDQPFIKYYLCKIEHIYLIRSLFNLLNEESENKTVL